MFFAVFLFAIFPGGENLLDLSREYQIYILVELKLFLCSSSLTFIQTYRFPISVLLYFMLLFGLVLVLDRYLQHCQQNIRLSLRFSLLIKSLINFYERVDFKVSLRLGLLFYPLSLTYPFLHGSPLHVHFSATKHLLLALGFLIDYCLRH